MRIIWKMIRFLVLGESEDACYIVRFNVNVRQTHSLFVAALGNVEELEFLLQQRPDLSRVYLLGENPLGFCIKRTTNYEICKLLLDEGVSCNERGEDGRQYTPFQLALAFSDLKIVRLFLDYGGDIAGLDWQGSPAYFHAIRNRNVNVLEFVMSQGIDVNCTDEDLWSGLHTAVQYRALEQCQLLLKRGALVNRIATSGITPLSLAVSDCRECSEVCARRIMVETLLEYGADVFDHAAGKTILETATDEHSCQSLIYLLIRRIAIMTCQGRSINEVDQRLIENDKCYRRFYRRCAVEIEGLKKAKLHDGISVFHILTKSQKVISGYANNQELVKALGDASEYLEKRYPIYFPTVRMRFNAVLECQIPRCAASKVLSTVFKFNDLSHPVVQKVLSFLSREDVKFLENASSDKNDTSSRLYVPTKFTSWMKF